ncbi:MAG: hypothetical protein QW706_09730, partial [Candidatus Nezhaarchaeales archaeon]
MEESTKPEVQGPGNLRLGRGNQRFVAGRSIPFLYSHLVRSAPRAPAPDFTTSLLLATFRPVLSA